MSLNTKPLVIADRTFNSRLILGTGKFASPEAMRDTPVAKNYLQICPFACLPFWKTCYAGRS